MRITVDTNVLLSATFWYGDSHRIIELIEQKKVTLVLSKQIIQEYSEVLKYDEIQKKIKDKDLQMKYSLQKIVSISEIVDPKEKIDVIKQDPSDNRILECAKEGKVDFIVTRDEKHLLPLGKFEGIQLLRPRELLDKLID